jgi:hypothetical protein
VSSESEIYGKGYDGYKFHVVFSVLIWESVGECGLYSEGTFGSFEWAI